MNWNYFQKILQFVWQGCKYLRTFEYSKVLNIPRIINVSGFRIYQGSSYNEKMLVLDLFFYLDVPFKTKIKHNLF